MESTAPTESKKTLRELAMRGSVIVFASYGVENLLQLASNLILTRLLFPEVFGIMAIVNVVMQGLQLFSDIGLGPSIIQHERGEEPQFLRTAWTMQVIRGFILWGCALVIAWPAAQFYNEPIILPLLAAVGLTAVFDGFNSTNYFVLDRRLELGKKTAISLSMQVVTVATTLVSALIWKSVWVLVLGGLVGVAYRMVLTHIFIDGPRMKFMLRREAAHDLYHFGKWIFIATAMGFVMTRVDRVVFGKLLSMERLGVYYIAFMWSQVIVQALGAISNRVLLPTFARVAKTGFENLRDKHLKARAALMAATLPPLWGLVIWSQEIIDFLYDSRYQEAGWMLLLLGIGAVFSVTLAPVSIVLLAVGDSFRHMLLLIARSAILLCALVVGYSLQGVFGIFLGLIAGEILYYPVLAYCVHRYKVWIPWLDFAAFAISSLVIGTALWLTDGWAILP